MGTHLTRFLERHRLVLLRCSAIIGWASPVRPGGTTRGWRVMLMTILFGFVAVVAVAAGGVTGTPVTKRVGGSISVVTYLAHDNTVCVIEPLLRFSEVPGAKQYILAWKDSGKLTGTTVTLPLPPSGPTEGSKDQIALAGDFSSAPCTNTGPTVDYYNGRFTFVSAEAVLPAGYKPPEKRIEGRVTRLACTEVGCRHVPVEGVTVQASSVSGGIGGSGISGKDGSYKIQDLHEGIWKVRPVVGTGGHAFPSSNIADLGSTDIAHLDFDVCSQEGSSSALPVCVPRFDYTMPERYSMTGSPLVTPLENFNPASFKPLFSIPAGACDVTAEYTWRIDGKRATGLQGETRCDVTLDFPKTGVYKVSVEEAPAASPGDKLTYTAEVNVADFVIASLGDSAASGEGNPPYFDVTKSPITSLVSGATAAAHQCDQSTRSYAAQAAYAIEKDAATRASVTFVDLACSGALLTEDANTEASLVGALSSENSNSGSTTTKPIDLSAWGKHYRASGHSATTIYHQLDQLKQTIGDREIAALTITIGINDLNWSGVVAECILLPTCQNRLDGPERDLVAKLPDLYSKLGAYIKALFPKTQLNPSDVYLVDYPDPLENGPTALCNAFSGLFAGPEIVWAEKSIVQPLIAAEQHAANANGWTYVPMPADVFGPHGYCTDQSWYHALSTVTATSYAGAFHPDINAQAAMRNQLMPYLQQALLPYGKPRLPHG